MEIGSRTQRSPRVPWQMCEQHLRRTGDEAEDPAAEVGPFVPGRLAAVADPGENQELERREPHRQVQPHGERRTDDVALVEGAPGCRHLLVKLRRARHPHRDRQGIDRAPRRADDQRDVDRTLAGLLPQPGELLLDRADRSDLVRALRAAAGEDHGESQRRRLRSGVVDQEVAQLFEIQPHEPVRRWSPCRGEPGPHRRVPVAQEGSATNEAPAPAGTAARAAAFTAFLSRSSCGISARAIRASRGIRRPASVGRSTFRRPAMLRSSRIPFQTNATASFASSRRSARTELV